MRKALGRWSSFNSTEPTRSSPKSFLRRASTTSSLPGSGAWGRNRPCCARYGAADCAYSSRLRIAALGGCVSRSSCSSLSSVGLSSSGNAGRTILSCCLPPSRWRTTRSDRNRKGLRLHALQQRIRHAGKQEQQRLQHLDRKVQFHAFDQTFLESRLHRKHQVRRYAASQQVQPLARLSQTRNQIGFSKRGELAAGADAPCVKRLRVLR